MNNLSGVLPHSLYNLSMLQELSVVNNSLAGSIPANVGERFPRIQVLHLSAN